MKTLILIQNENSIFDHRFSSKKTTSVIRSAITFNEIEEFTGGNFNKNNFQEMPGQFIINLKFTSRESYGRIVANLIESL